MNEFADWLHEHSDEHGIQLGEYSFTDYYQDEETGEWVSDEFFYEDLASYAMESLQSKPVKVMGKLIDKNYTPIIDKVVFDQPSSKSGVIAYVDHSVAYDDYDTVNEDWTTDEVNDIWANFVEEKRALLRELKIVQEVIEQSADGKRSGCFSNGEVVFSPIGNGKAKKWETFTAYWNPNLGQA